MKTRHFVFSIFLLLSFMNARADWIPRFESAEHQVVGDSVKIRFNQTQISKTGRRFQLDNGLQLSYGEILLLGGDFYAVEASPISSAPSLLERKALFLKAFESLNQNPLAVSEVTNILAILKNQEDSIRIAEKAGTPPDVTFAATAESVSIAWNCATGGMCPADYPFMSPETFRKIYFLKPGRYLRLLNQDFDHFGEEAIHAYQAGHQLALEKAIAAGRTQDENALGLAYAMNAFACHYLSDIFSAGHMRVPRHELSLHVQPATLGSLLSVYMHQEDSEQGLTVSNANGDTWIAYGDKHMMNPLDAINVKILEKALQASSDAIYQAYLSGNQPSTDSALAYAPNLFTLRQNPKNPSNPAPLFYWDDTHKILYRRVNLADASQYQWTSDWLGWKTYYELSQLRNMNSAALDYFISELNQ